MYGNVGVIDSVTEESFRKLFMFKTISEFKRTFVHAWALRISEASFRFLNPTELTICSSKTKHLKSKQTKTTEMHCESPKMQEDKPDMFLVSFR